MSDSCCVIPHTGDNPTCPMNSQVTAPVGRQTLESLVRPEIKAELTAQSYFFCDAPDCDTVYVSALGDHLITKDQLTVRVGIKETDDPIPLCYCFGYDRKDVRADIRRKGDTDIQEIITARMRAGECTCEVTNPSGECCLGTVAKEIRYAQALRYQDLLPAG